MHRALFPRRHAFAPTRPHPLGNSAGELVEFPIAVTPWLLIQGLSYALSMAFVGALLPALKAARLPIASALREL